MQGGLMRCGDFMRFGRLQGASCGDPMNRGQPWAAAVPLGGAAAGDPGAAATPWAQATACAPATPWVAEALWVAAIY